MSLSALSAVTFPVSAFLDGQYQIQGANFQGNGTYLLGAGPDDVVSNFRFNTGISNTFPGGELTNVLETPTPITTPGVYVDALINTLADKMAHFDNPSGGVFRYISKTPIRAIIDARMSLEAVSNNDVGIAINHFDASAATDTLIVEISQNIRGGGQGDRAENVGLASLVDLEFGDTLNIKLKNSANNNITVLLGARIFITEVG